MGQAVDGGGRTTKALKGLMLSVGRHPDPSRYFFGFVLF